MLSISITASHIKLSAHTVVVVGVVAVVVIGVVAW